MFKKINLENYKEFINKIILNEKIKEEIIEKINSFNKNGEIVLDGYNLYAKNKREKDFLDIKYQNNSFFCFFWNCGKFITISQKELENKFVKLERKETTVYKSDDNINSTRKEEIEEIYNSLNKLMYDAKLTNSVEYITKDNFIHYVNDSYFINNFELEKNWYISNGSIIKYNLSKFYMNEDSNIEERYSICPAVYKTDFETYYNFVKLDEELFKSFMLGNISIEEVLDKIDKKEFNKSLRKSIGNVDII